MNGYAGMGSRVPVSAFAFAVLSLAMVGVPPAVGFVGKWYIVLGAVNTENWAVVTVLLASTLLTLAYFARLVERLYFAEATIHSKPDEAPVTDGSGQAVSFGMIAVVVIAAALAVALTAAVPAFERCFERRFHPC